jgi:hypothetical protein
MALLRWIGDFRVKVVFIGYRRLLDFFGID